MATTYKLCVLEGPDAGAVYDLPEGDVQVDRSPRNDVPLSDP